MKIIPTVFANNKKEFLEKFDRVSKLNVRAMQIDFMDGKFVGKKSPGLNVVKGLSRKIGYEAHLMVSNPTSWVGKLKSKGFKKVIFHYGSLKDIGEIGKVVSEINSKKMNAWIAFNPNVKLDKIIEVVTSVSGLGGVMFMGHKPGKEKVGLDSKVVDKIRTLRKMFARLKIQVDGGIDDRSIIRLKKAGVDVVNVGSFISSVSDLKEMKANLRVLKAKIK